MQDKDIEFKYFRFPLFLLRDLFSDKNEVLNAIIKFGIYDFSTKVNYCADDVLTQVIYGIYRGGLTQDLKRYTDKLQNNNKLDLDNDYSGFKLSEFNPEYELEQLLPIYNSDGKFRELAIQFYQIKKAYERLSISGNFDNCIKYGKETTKTIPDREPMPMAEKDLVFKYRDNETSEFDLMQFACFIAVNSIIGTNHFTKTNYEMIFARAFGYSTAKQVPESVKNSDLFVKYTKRHHREKILNYLELNWNILKYSNQAMRGFYVGKEKKTTYEAMANYELKNRKSTQIENLKQLKKVAYLNAKNNQ